MNQENNNFNGMPTGPAFDPMTGQPIQPQQPVQPQGFDPMTGQPIQQPIQNPAFAQAPQQSMQPQVGQPQKKSNNKLFIIGGICLAIVAVIVVIIALTGGAGGKKLVCTMEEELSGLDFKATITASFKGNNVSKMNIDMSYDLGDLSSYKDMLMESLEAEFEEYKENGIKVNISDKGDIVNINMEATEKNFKELGYATSESYEDAKKELEDSGFVCK